VHQTYANGRVQQFLDRAYRSAGAPQEFAPVELARAEADLRHALELDPTLVEARIRRAHVIGELGKPEEAVALATDALRAKLPPFFESYAWLVLGRNQIRAGRLDEARTAFERAAALEPTGQAARIGLSQVALAAGRPSEALAVLTDFLGPGRSVEAAEEVWERYYRIHDPEATEQLAALRAEVR
jgi:predicted Zn-dependent protease